MAKKILCFSIIILISIFLLNVSYATDISMDLDNITSSSTQTTDDTTYTSGTNIDTDTDADTTTTEETTYNDYKPVATTTDYNESTDLSISNIINIILIVVGVVLILLGIAIIIKLN